MAAQLLSANDGLAAAGDFLEFRFRLDAFTQRVAKLIEDGVESVTPARRGRPKRRPLNR